MLKRNCSGIHVSPFLWSFNCVANNGLFDVTYDHSVVGESAQFLDRYFLKRHIYKT